jgi:GT2 family glycosyltransferase
VAIVRPEDQDYLADLAHSHRENLQELVAELRSRREPLTPLEARLILDAVEVRLGFVDYALRAGKHRRASRALGVRSRTVLWPQERLRRAAARTVSWTRPRIGRLRHYEPKPLRVPAKYERTRLPIPAPSIALVTPSFQQGRFLGRTLYSVFRQQYPRLEYVVQDGGSSDETVEVLRRFDSLLTRWKSEPDNGQADAINLGFQHTTGEIMGWLNSDDLLLPGSLAYVARYFQEHPEVDVVYGHRILIDENDGQIGAWILPRHDDLALTLADFVPQETLFWRRRIWDAAGGCVDARFAFALDWDLLLRFRDAGAKMARVPRYLGAFRVHDRQKTTAADHIGIAECSQLRERIHGRVLSMEEVLRGLTPYLKRHIIVHTRHRAIDRLPLRRVQVVTVPPETALRGPDEADTVGSNVAGAVIVARPALTDTLAASPMQASPANAGRHGGDRKPDAPTVPEPRTSSPR